MYDSNTLGHQNPRALLHSMWLICTTYFGMRTGQEVYNLRWGDVTLCLDESCGREYIQLDTERQTKTRTGSNPKDTRLLKPRAYANPEDPARDPVFLYKMYKEKRPSEMDVPDTAFFLTPGSGGQLSSYRKNPVGINKIYGIMQEMKEDAGIKAPRITPYSARKRLIQKLNDDGVPPNQIIQISGHKNVNSLNNYSHLNTNQTRNISDILCNRRKQESTIPPPRKPTPPTSPTHDVARMNVNHLNQGANQSLIPPGFFVNPTFNGNVSFTFSNQSLSQTRKV